MDRNLPDLYMNLVSRIGDDTRMELEAIKDGFRQKNQQFINKSKEFLLKNANSRIALEFDQFIASLQDEERLNGIDSNNQNTRDENDMNQSNQVDSIGEPSIKQEMDMDSNIKIENIEEEFADIVEWDPFMPIEKNENSPPCASSSNSTTGENSSTSIESNNIMMTHSGMQLRKHRTTSTGLETQVKKRRSGKNETPSCSQPNGEEVIDDGQYAPTVFDQLNPQCFRKLMDWLDIDSLYSLSQTCKRLQAIVKSHFRSHYQSHVVDIGNEEESEQRHFKCFDDIIQHLQLSGASIDDFTYAAQNVNRNLRELTFNSTKDYIAKEHVDSIKSILKNVRSVDTLDCIFKKYIVEYLLEQCKHIEEFAFSVRKDSKFRFRFNKTPTLRVIDINFCPKSNVFEMLQSIQNQNVQLDELILTFTGDQNDSMEQIFDILDAMHERNVFKELYLNFGKPAIVSEHTNRLASVRGLVGLICSYRINDNINHHLSDLVQMRNTKYLGIHWLFTNPDIISQQLTELTELKVTEATIEAITSFVRYSVRLQHFHIEHVQGNKTLDLNTLNNLRAASASACKLNIYLSEQKFMELKWTIASVVGEFVEIKREESYIPNKRPPKQNI